MYFYEEGSQTLQLNHGLPKITELFSLIGLFIPLDRPNSTVNVSLAPVSCQLKGVCLLAAFSP